VREWQSGGVAEWRSERVAEWRPHLSVEADAVAGGGGAGGHEVERHEGQGGRTE
jgi:hypothetical protein